MSSKTGTSSASDPGAARRRAFGRWVALMARCHEGSATPIEGGYSVKGRGGHWRARDLPRLATPILREPEKDDAEAWEHRLRLVEKPAAEELASGAASFAVRIDPKGKEGGEELEVLRCAFGVAAVSGRLSLWRGTAYQIEPWGALAVRSGSDALFDREDLEETSLGRPRALRKRLEQVTAGIEGAVERFLDLQPTLDAQSDQQSALTLAVQELDALYFGGGEGQLELFGLRPKTASLDGAVESEYRRRLKEIYTRNRFTVQIRILSIGLVRCTGRKRKVRGGIDLELPFVRLSGEDLAP